MTNSNRIKLTWISFLSYALTGALVIVTGMVMGNIADYFNLPVSSMSNTFTGQSETSIMQSLTPEKIAAILPLQFFPQPADFTGPYVMLASRRNNRALSGVMINADAGLAIRGIRHVAAGFRWARQPGWILIC